VADHLDFLWVIQNQNGKARMEELVGQARLSEKDLDKLVEDGHVPAEDRAKVREDADRLERRLQKRASKVTWKLSDGRIRSVYVDGDANIYEVFSEFEADLELPDDMISLPAEGYHRSIFIRTASLDYIWAPSQRYSACALELAEELDAN